MEDKSTDRDDKFLKAEFREYRRIKIAEMRPVTKEEANLPASFLQKHGVSISDADIANGSPKIGDMIARNPKNHKDMWLVAEDYFKDNFETII